LSPSRPSPRLRGHACVSTSPEVRRSEFQPALAPRKINNNNPAAAHRCQFRSSRHCKISKLIRIISARPVIRGFVSPFCSPSCPSCRPVTPQARLPASYVFALTFCLNSRFTVTRYRSHIHMPWLSCTCRFSHSLFVSAGHLLSVIVS